MNKLQKLAKGITTLIKKPYLINAVIEHDSQWSNRLSTKYPNSTQLPVVNFDDLLPDFNGKVECYSFLGGGSMVTDIALLKGLCEKTKNCNYFEIGTWRGESIVNVADYCKDAFTLNLSEQEIKALGLGDRYAELHGFYSKKNKKITHLFGDSKTFDFKGLNKKFDVIFIDGNHHYDYVKEDTANVFKHLMHENSIVVWHDYAFSPEKLRPEILLGILDGIPSQCKENLYHVSNTMCAIYLPNKIESTPFITPVEPAYTYEVEFKRRKVVS